MDGPYDELLESLRVHLASLEDAIGDDDSLRVTWGLRQLHEDLVRFAEELGITDVVFGPVANP